MRDRETAKGRVGESGPQIWKTPVPARRAGEFLAGHLDKSLRPETVLD
jgi:hypothetical protein